MGIGAAALAGCTGADLPDSVEPASSGWGLPQGTAAGTRTNPTTDYITANLRSVAQFGVDEESPVDRNINATIPDREGVLLFSDNGVTQTAWSGSENWQYETDSPVLTGALIQNVVVVVLADEVIGLQYTSGDVLWTTTTADVEAEIFASEPTFTEYITATDGELLAGVRDVVCIGTENDTGLVIIHAGTGDIESAYVSDGTGVLESNPAYDRANGVLVLSTSNARIGLNGQTLEEEFSVESGISQDLFTHYGISITHTGAGSITAIDTTIEQQYENDIESIARESRNQWSMTDTSPVRGGPSRVGAQAVFPTDTGVEAVSVTSGVVTWRAEELGACEAVASSKGHLYALTSQGRVFVLDGLTGDVITDHFVEGEWDDLSVWGEYILLTGESNGVVVLQGDESEDGLEPLLDLLQEDIMDQRLRFTENEEIQGLADEPINSLDDMPGSDIDGLVQDILQQYENGDIPYIRARNMLERMMYYFEMLDMSLEFIQENEDGIDPFTVGDNRAVGNESLLLPPEMEYFGDRELGDYTNPDVSLALLYSRRLSRAVFDAISSIPGKGPLKAPMEIWGIITGEFGEMGDEFYNYLFELLMNSGVEETEQYINDKLEQDLIPQWVANALFAWITNTVSPATIVVNDPISGDVRILRPELVTDTIDALIEHMAESMVETHEFSAEITRRNIVGAYTDIPDDEYMIENPDHTRDNDEPREILNPEIPVVLRDSFYDRHQGITAADVPKNVTESDLFDNLDSVDSLPGNQTQAAATSLALQRRLVGQTQGILGLIYPYEFFDTAMEARADLEIEGQQKIANAGADVLDVDEDVELEDTLYEDIIRFRFRVGQGVADVLGISSVANLTHTLLSSFYLRGGLNETMALVSDQGSHDILFGVNESDPGAETLLSKPPKFTSEDRTGFDDYGDAFEERIQEDNRDESEDEGEDEDEAQNE